MESINTHFPSRASYFVVSVDVRELPLVAGHAHPLKLRPQVDELPPFLSLLVVLFGVVGERVELLIGYCTEEKNIRAGDEWMER